MCISHISIVECTYDIHRLLISARSTAIVRHRSLAQLMRGHTMSDTDDDLERPARSYSEARSAGRRYYIGCPCKHGHTVRFASNRTCIVCRYADQTQTAGGREAARLRQAAYRKRGKAAAASPWERIVIALMQG